MLTLRRDRKMFIIQNKILKDYKRNLQAQIMSTSKKHLTHPVCCICPVNDPQCIYANKDTCMFM